MPKRKATPAAQTEPIGMTLDQLPVEARLRVEYAGRWVAWAADEKSVLAAADTHAEVREAAIRAGFERFLCEWVPPVPIRPLRR